MENANTLVLVQDNIDSATPFHLMELYQQLSAAEVMTCLSKGRILFLIKQDHTYRKLGSHLHHWHDFLREYHISYGTAGHYMRVYKKFSKYMEGNDDALSNVPFNRLLRMVTIPDEHIPELLSVANTHDEAGFMDKLRAIKGKIESINCPHDDTSLWSKCNKCGAWFPYENIP